MVSERPELEAALRSEMADTGVAALPVVVPTPWHGGAVAAYLFPDEPVTLVDAGDEGPESREAFEAAFASAGRRIEDLERVVVTHGHTDHFGSARWLQERSGCEVLMHPQDADRLRDREAWPERARALFRSLGFSEEVLETFFSGGVPDWDLPELRPLEDGGIYPSGATRLRVEHRPGHSRGHVWFTDEATGAMLCGDYLLADGPTNAGLEPDPSHPLGRVPMLQGYNEALRELREREVPLILPGHGPPVVDHRAVIDRRLAKTEHRTERALRALAEHGPCTPAELAGRMFGERLSANPYGFLSDLVGRLDLLWAEGRAEAREGDDGAWRFRARTNGRATDRRRTPWRTP